MKKLTLLIAFISVLLFAGCNDAVEAAHGLATFLFVILKWGFIILVVGFIIAFIVGLFNKK